MKEIIMRIIDEEFIKNEKSVAKTNRCDIINTNRTDKNDNKDKINNIIS